MKSYISPIAIDRIPTFAKKEYPKFVEFAKAYFESLETNDSFMDALSSWSPNNSIDTAADEYSDKILEDLGVYFEKTFAVNKSHFLHFLRDFYLTRGTERSFHLLFKLLFNENVEIRYPRESMLIPSHAEYGERFFIYVSADNFTDFETLQSKAAELGGTITGLQSSSVASIQSIEKIGSNGELVEIEILKPLTDFNSSETCSIEIDLVTIFENIIPVAELVIDEPGINFKVGDSVQVTDCIKQGIGRIERTISGGVNSIEVVSGVFTAIDDQIFATTDDGGSGFFGRVTETVGGKGTLVSVAISSPGRGYFSLPKISLVRGPNNPFEFDDIEDIVVELTPSSDTIGGIKTITVLEPFIGPSDDSYVVIRTENGSGQNILIRKKAVFTKKSWENNRGFIGETSTLINSDKVQQFSYETVSSVRPSKYKDVVLDLLHPAGYKFTPTTLVGSEHIFGQIFSVTDTLTNRFYNFEYTLNIDLSSETTVEAVVDTDKLIVTQNNEVLATNNNELIIYSEEGDNYIVGTDGIDEFIIVDDAEDPITYY